MKSAFFTCLFCAAALVAGAAFAEIKDASQLSPEEITKLFETQKTRGLVIAPSGGATTEAPAAGTEVAADPGYAQVDPDAQVNIRISFGFDSAALQESEKVKLSSLCQALKTTTIPLFKIVGHTDASGSDQYNQRLSLLRAEEVKRHLVSNCGIPEGKLQAVGVGEAFPVDPADPRAEANRRVEFQVAS